MTCAHKKQGLDYLLDKLMTYIDTFTQSLADIDVTGKHILLILNLYHDIFLFSPHCNPHYLSKLIQIIEPLKYLPQPYESVIKETVKCFKQEISAPGYTLREECVGNYVFLNQYGENLVNSKHITSVIIASKIQYGVFLFHNIPSFSSTIYNHIFQKTYISDADWINSIFSLRCKLLYDILHFDFVTSPSIEGLIPRCDQTLVVDWYRRARDVQDVCVAMY